MEERIYEYPDHFIRDEKTGINVYVEDMDERTLRAFAHYVFAHARLNRAEKDAAKPS